MSRELVLLTSGTRGDVQPILALGLGLQEAGCRVRLAAPAGFGALAEAWGLPFSGFSGNPSDLLARPGGQAALAFRGNVLGGLRASLDYLRQARPLYAQALAGAWQACQGAGTLVIGLPSLWGVHIAQALGIPCLWACLQPLVPTRFFPSALFPAASLAGSRCNHLTYWLVEQALWQPWREVTNRWRTGLLGLPPAPFWGPPGPGWGGALVLNGFSPAVVPPPADWLVAHAPTGFWFLPPRPAALPPPDLARFVESGPPPVYIGFGSPGALDPSGLPGLVAEAARRAGVRVVLSLPAGAPGAAGLAGEIFSTGEVDHAWLFPRLAGVVHHGGAGTTAAGLRAGLPSLLLPRAADQFFWAGRVAALGVGPLPVAQRSLNTGNLSVALRRLVEDPALRQAAAGLGRTVVIRAEDGVGQAVQRIREWGLV